jgi:hypothetical protein
MNVFKKMETMLNKKFKVGDKIRKPIFIVGCGRAGTTLLFDIVSQHPDLARIDGYPGGGSALWIDYWYKVNTGIERQMQSRADQLLTIRYEDLISKPTEVLGSLTSFCNLESHDFSIEHLQKNTHLKHTSLMTEDLRRAIFDQAQLVRMKFGYVTGGANELAKSLYIP